MLRKPLVIIAAVSALAFTSCNKEIEYNSNSDGNGSRDSATQILVNTTRVDDISAPDGDNEDWFYFTPTEDGLAKVGVFVDKPTDVIVQLGLLDSFGRPIHETFTNHNDNIYELPEMTVAKEKYFFYLRTREGKSSYSLKVDFRIPEPEPVCEIGTFICEDNVLKQCFKTGYETMMTCEGATPVCDAEFGECKKPSGGGSSRCVPANKCKPGQKCCKDAVVVNEDDILETEKTVRGTIVLVTPRGSDLADVKISGLGSSKGVKAGAKAYLRGLKRKVDIYDCKTTFCMATIKATSEELTHYDKVDVVVE